MNALDELLQMYSNLISKREAAQAIITYKVGVSKPPTTPSCANFCRKRKVYIVSEFQYPEIWVTVL